MASVMAVIVAAQAANQLHWTQIMYGCLRLVPEPILVRAIACIDFMFYDRAERNAMRKAGSDSNLQYRDLSDGEGEQDHQGDPGGDDGMAFFDFDIDIDSSAGEKPRPQPALEE